jgi:hypothetical protein
MCQNFGKKSGAVLKICSPKFLWQVFSAKFPCLWQLWICLQLLNNNKLKGKWRHGTIFHESNIKGLVIHNALTTTPIYSPFTHAMEYMWNVNHYHIFCLVMTIKKADFYWNTWLILHVYIRRDFGQYDTICWLFVFIIVSYYLYVAILLTYRCTMLWSSRQVVCTSGSIESYNSFVVSVESLATPSGDDTFSLITGSEILV